MDKAAPKKKAPSKVLLKQGSLSDQEKRSIEQLIKFENYATIAKKLNRNPGTIRKWCQRNGITTDHASVGKNIEEKKKRSPHFEELTNILTDREMDLAVKIYTDVMKQFGGDVLPSEEIQVIDFCLISALLNRALGREKEILRLMEQQTSLRDALEEEKGKMEDEDEKDNWYDKVDQVDMRIGALSDELKECKKNQLSFIDKKEKHTNSMGASRNARAKELSKSNENWGDFVMFVKTNVGFRTKLGLELEKHRLSIQEEFIRLSALHEFADGIVDYPILNSDVMEMEGANILIEEKEEV